MIYIFFQNKYFNDEHYPTFYHKRKAHFIQNHHFEKLTRNTVTDLIDIEKIIKYIEKVNINTIHQQIFKGIDLNKTLLNYVWRKVNIEEAIIMKKREINKDSEINLLLVDTSYSMLKHWDDQLQEYIENQSKKTVILFHHEGIYMYADFKNFSNPTFSGRTSYYYSLKTICSIVQKLNRPCTIEHISDGEISNLELNKTLQLLNESTFKYKYTEVKRKERSKYYLKLIESGFLNTHYI